LDESTIRLFPRFSVDQVKTALIDTPVVMVTGPRQCGKTAWSSLSAIARYAIVKLLKR
jgi:predicted AAA+ superfamily ATPase